MLACHVLHVAVEVIRVLGLHAVAGAKVHVVHHDVLEGYAMRVFVVLDDGDLMVAEVLESHEHASSLRGGRLMSSPGSGESTKCMKVRVGFPRQGAFMP